MEIRQKVPDPEDPEGFDNPMIEFDANEVVVDIDFRRPYRVPSKKKGRGIRFDAKLVCSVVLMDSNGHLRERILPLDKSHPGKRILADRVWNAPTAKKLKLPKPPTGSRPGAKGGKFGKSPPGRGRKGGGP